MTGRGSLRRGLGLLRAGASNANATRAVANEALETMKIFDINLSSSQRLYSTRSLIGAQKSLTPRQRSLLLLLKAGQNT